METIRAAKIKKIRLSL